ncbi:MAG: sigma-70 family RNA polymerase sigma factor [Actinobacteria bacterium]|nr:sigma-70 family RNA polymerase sigma factor [Actinomycetota bacterium]
MDDGTVSSAFREFYLREHDAQVRRAAIIVRSPEQANDLVHDAMAEMYARWTEIREPGAYLNRAVLNRCRDAARRAGTHGRFVARFVDRPDAAAPQEPLGDLFDGLPFQQRAALVLKYYADLSTAEIAEALQCPQGSVGPWIDRGLKKLRERLS